MAELDLMSRLSLIQNELKCNKGQYNKFGKYNYRSCEDILEAVKPICKKHGVCLILQDEIVNVGERYYVKATASLRDLNTTEKLDVSAYAREPATKTGMDESQITGTASSYARKYALNGLFNIDDTKDADTDEYALQSQSQAERYVCADCGAEFEPFTWKGKSYTAKQAYEIAQKKSADGKARCKTCREKIG